MIPFKRIVLIALCLLCSGNFLWAQNKGSMRSKNVCVLDTAFYIPQLNRHRRIWVYLPPSYCTSRKKFPVLYLQDGQNVFDEATSFSGEWGVDETLDSLAHSLPQTIVVAIDNGGEKRMNEYNPYDTEQFGKGEGKAYVDFLAHTLKPFIDKRFRTKKGARHTSIAGSSMGGLIAMYALLHYPGTFGNGGIFSPAFWMAPLLKDDIISKAKKVKGNLYFYAGKSEEETMVPGMLAVFNLMNQHSKAKMTSVIREGKHNEAAWRKEFPFFYRWLVTGGAAGK